MAFQSLYDILGVAPAATPEEIKDAYRRQAMKWHPDRNLNNRAESEERFKEIGYAYKVLSDPQQRVEYDAYLASQQAGTAQQQRQDSSYGAGMSDADAAKMFFEQMLDLAFELARRGYDGPKIHKMLLALDCPESVAKAVVEMVVNAAKHSHHTNTNANAHREYATAAEPIPHEYAGFWVRAGASMVDGLAVTVLAIPLIILLAVVGVEPDSVQATLASILVGWIYYAIGESGVHQATFGKRAMGLKVTDVHGEQISFGRAAFRHLGRFISMLTLYIGYLIQPFTRRRQTLHDLITSTVVLRTEKKGNWIAVVSVGLVGLAVVGILAAIAIPAYADYVAKSERMALQQQIKSAFATRMAFADQPQLSPNQLAAMNIWNKQFVERMAQEKAAADELVKIFKKHPDLRNGTEASNYDPFAPHYVLTDQIAYHLSEGKAPLQAVQAAYSEIEPIGFPESIRRVKKSVQDEFEQAAIKANQAKMTEELNAVIKEMESRHPEFNENSPRFSQLLVDQALARMKAYVDKGMAPASALRQAITDMEREAEASRTVRR